MENDDNYAIRNLIDLWYETRVWALILLKEKLGLPDPRHVLKSEFRGKNQLPESEWWYRTHGIGVDIFKPGNKGGIDFDFDKTAPDAWRLRVFLVKQYNDGKLKKSMFKPLLQDQDRWNHAISKELC